MTTLNRNNSNWSFEERRKINENWEILESMANSTANGNNSFKQEIDELKTRTSQNTNVSTQANQIANRALVNGNTAIAKSEEAARTAKLSEVKADESRVFADEAVQTANYVQSQLDNIITDGDSSAEVVQARGENATLRDRLDNDLRNVNNEISNRLNVVNLDLYAAADGATVDDQNIRTAIEYLHSIGGGILYAPSQYYLLNTVTIPYNDIIIKGEKDRTVFNLASNGKFRFAANFSEELPRTNPLAQPFNNLPNFNPLDYFEPSEYGGVDFRSFGVGIMDVRFNKVTGSEGSQHCLQFWKCDNLILENIKVTFDNPQTSLGTTQDNPITFYYCSYGKIKNIKIENNYRITFGMFVFWSFGMDLENIEIGNVGEKCLELKHIVSSTLNRFRANVEIENQAIRGISLNYGSNNVTLKNIQLVNCELGLSSSNEFNYTENVTVKNVKITNAVMDLQNLKGFNISNVDILLKNNRTQVQGILFTAQPFYENAVIDMSTVNKNTDYFTFDGDYDFYQNLTFGGVNHYRLFVQKQQPTLLNGILEKINIVLDKTQGGRNVDFYTIFTQGVTNASPESLVADGRLKVRDGYLPISISNIKMKGIKTTINGDGNSAVTVSHTFLQGPRWSLQDVVLEDIDIIANNASGSGNTPDISALSLFNLAKFENVTWRRVKFLPYTRYGVSASNLRAYNNVTFDQIELLTGNLDGSFNPTNLNLIELRTGILSTDTFLNNEDFQNITFNNCNLKGIGSFLFFNRSRNTISQNQLTNPRFIANNIINTARTSENYVFMRDSSNSAVTQTPQRILNSFNNVGE